MTLKASQKELCQSIATLLQAQSSSPLPTWIDRSRAAKQCGAVRDLQKTFQHLPNRPAQTLGTSFCNAANRRGLCQKGKMCIAQPKTIEKDLTETWNHV